MGRQEGTAGEVGATATELAVLMPVVIVMLMLPVQVGLWWHARQVADAAVEEALDVAQVVGATDGDGQSAAVGLLAQAGNLREATVTVRRDASDVFVEVTGRAPQVVPFVDWGVTSRAAGPIERLVPEPER
jgi:Flp pilus assembly protein TadG